MRRSSDNSATCQRHTLQQRTSLHGERGHLFGLVHLRNANDVRIEARRLVAMILLRDDVPSNGHLASKRFGSPELWSHKEFVPLKPVARDQIF
jgi:hypothetical protein